MCLALIEGANARLQSFRAGMRAVLEADTAGLAFDRYYAAFPTIDIPREELLHLAGGAEAPLARVRDLLLSHSNLLLPDILTFTLNDAVAAYPGAVTPEALHAILDAWSHSFGDLEGDDPGHFFLGNPVWQRPLIHLDADLYFWPVTALFFSSCLQLMEQVTTLAPTMAERYERRRGAFLEEEVAHAFAAAFPDAQPYRGSQWTDPATGRQYENDLLVRLDSHFLIVEAKAGKVTGPARRGGEERLQHTIKDLVIKPSEQAQRFATYLRVRDHSGPYTFPTKRGADNVVDTTGVREVLTVSITLESLGPLASRWPALRDAGFLPAGVDLAPTMSLADLQIVFEMLESQSEKLHYLARRAELEAHALYTGDELDLLAFYLASGFVIGEAEYDGSLLPLYGISRTLDPYFMRRWAGGDAPKPRRQLTSWWQLVLRRLEARRQPRWREIGRVLLELDTKDQTEFERGFRRVQTNVRRFLVTRSRPNYVAQIVGPPQRRVAIVGFAYRGLAGESLRQSMLAIAVKAAVKEPVKGMVVVGMDVEKHCQSYTAMAYVDRRDIERAVVHTSTDHR